MKQIAYNINVLYFKHNIIIEELCTLE